MAAKQRLFFLLDGKYKNKPQQEKEAAQTKTKAGDWLSCGRRKCFFLKSSASVYNCFPTGEVGNVSFQIDYGVCVGVGLGEEMEACNKIFIQQKHQFCKGLPLQVLNW